MATLLIQAYGEPSGSRHDRALLAAAAAVPGVTLHDLAVAYPSLRIDPVREAALLAVHHTVVLQFPMHWYAVPAIARRWIDEALVHGCSHGSARHTLRGKRFWVACTVSGPAGQHAFNVRHPLESYCAFLEKTARLCGMHWEPPFVVDRVIWDRLDETDLVERAGAYAARLALGHSATRDGR